MLVYRWPPQLTVVGAEWTIHDPVNTSYSLFTGAVSMTASQRRRRMVVLNVEGAFGDNGGLIEALKALLKGGRHAVRLYSYPLNFGEPVGTEVPLIQQLTWVDGATPLTWVSGSETLSWFAGPEFGATGLTLTLLAPMEGIGRARVEGLTPNADIARTGSFVTVFDGSAQETRQLIRAVRSSSAGVANIWTETPFTLQGAVQFNTRDTGVFLPMGLPRAVRPAAQTWQTTWEFREIFADEIAPDTFTEVPVPWASND